MSVVVRSIERVVVVRTTERTVTVAIRPEREAVVVHRPGPQGPAGEQGEPGIDAHYTHAQGVAATVWNVAHNLGKYPAVSVIDSGGSEVIGSVDHDSVNALTLTFSAAFSGIAVCN